jgi:hypothetical protein
MIQERIAQGVYIKDIAEELGVHPRTVSRAIGRGGSPSGRRPAARGSKLDAYKPTVDRLLATDRPGLAARPVFGQRTKTSHVFACAHISVPPGK